MVFYDNGIYDNGDNDHDNYDKDNDDDDDDYTWKSLVIFLKFSKV